MRKNSKGNAVREAGVIEWDMQRTVGLAVETWAGSVEARGCALVKGGEV